MAVKARIVLDGPQGKITSLTVDKDDFEEMLTHLQGIVEIQSGKRAAEAQIDSIRAANHLPLISRGTKTQPVFDMFQIETDLATICVSGAGVGRQIASKMGLIPPNPEDN
jgi:hypothetical protein